MWKVKVKLQEQYINKQEGAKDWLWSHKDITLIIIIIMYTTVSWLHFQTLPMLCDKKATRKPIFQCSSVYLNSMEKKDAANTLFEATSQTRLLASRKCFTSHSFWWQCGTVPAFWFFRLLEARVATCRHALYDPNTSVMMLWGRIVRYAQHEYYLDMDMTLPNMIFFFFFIHGGSMV